MSIIKRFTTDYLNYLLSIILPALISGIAVPVLKHLLGAANYGYFSIYYNGALICTAISTGWITQSIYRFYSTSHNKNQFSRLAISIAIKYQLIIVLPIMAFLWFFRHDFLLAILIGFTIFINAMQFSYLAIAQSSFLSKKTIYSETIRSVSYIVIAVILLLITTKDYLYFLFVAIIISYSLSVIYLRTQTKNFFLMNNVVENSGLNFKKLSKKFIHYGFPLSLWVFFAFLFPYVDKLLMLKNLGPSVQGNYQAIFDLLYRGLSLLISPVVISLVPLLVQAYEKNEKTEIKKLSIRIVLFEVGGFLIASMLYWWFGATLLFKILNIPDLKIFRYMGYIVLTGSFVWQIAMVVHQKYILKLRSSFLLILIIISFLAQLIFYWINAYSKNPLIYPFGYLIATSVYLFLLSFSHLSMKSIKKHFLIRKKINDFYSQ